MNKLEILIRPVSEFRTRNDIALHSLEPSYDKLLELCSQAEKDMFPRIVIYTKRGFASRTNIKNGMSTWSRLIRDYAFADVRAGEVGFKHGTSDGDGFTIYFENDLQLLRDTSAVERGEKEAIVAITKTKFTPGPWQVNNLDSREVIGEPGTGDHFAIGDNCPTVANCATGDNDWNVQVANAALIAAAPELYNALEELILSVETYSEETTANYLEIAKGVLAKARGES